MAERPIRIGLLWHSANSGNLGVGALTIANMAIAREVAREMGLSPHFTIVGMKDRGEPYVTREEAESFHVDTRTLIDPAGCWSKFKQLDCVLDIGAGDSFAEIYGFKRFAFLWLTKAQVLARRKPLLLSPQTIGPFSREPYLSLAKGPLNRAYAVVARDAESLQALQRLAPQANAELSVDVAFALPFDDNSRLRGGTRQRVGVNVSGLLFNEAVSGRNRFGLSFDYAALMRGFIANLLKGGDCEVHLVPHAIDAAGGDDDDNRVADLLAEEFPGVIRVPSFPSPSGVKSYISGLDFLVAGRMHACIAAFSAGTPVVPVAYSRKFRGLFGMLGYEHLVPVTGLSTEEAGAFLFDRLQRRDELTAAQTLGMAKVGELLDVYRATLQRLFRHTLSSGHV